ncbi:MAG: hypothetical protein CL607_27850 [Anaerolineaceae bacterium]|nr:hypothetical protein [Anaerolineaceae bacterium]
MAEQIETYITAMHMMRDGALDRVNDADLNFSPGGSNITLWQLFMAFADTQVDYIQSLHTLKFDPGTSSQTSEKPISMSMLRERFKETDSQILTILRSLTEDDFQQQVERPNQVMRSVREQFQIYVEAAMIFLGKLVIYFNTMEKELPPSVAFYIA